MYKALVKVWKTKEKASEVKISQPRGGAHNPTGDEGRGNDELMSIVVTAQTPGGLVKKVNTMVGVGLTEEMEEDAVSGPGYPTPYADMKRAATVTRPKVEKPTEAEPWVEDHQ
ncbi:hypothetical protein Mbo2_046 [Rhodococcus phage Mbo2]|uniref:Uncharacterized protein n=1 Tax=Rhodococcus phage Mbo2 TaxID=2936911 RepID=A0A9E7IPL3_9CAUD|nr:hypothetical protein Mbo2_046 [Rhodococcus phage Mbo2]